MNLLDEVDKIKKDGYSEANAEAKLCQNIIIKASVFILRYQMNSAMCFR